MKTPLRLLLAAAVCATALPTQAQTPSSTPPPELGAKPEGKRWGNRFDRMVESLPEDMSARFRQLHDEALQDPKIVELKAKADAARNEYRDAMRDMMKAKDPELAEKVRAHFESRRPKDGEGKPRKKKIEDTVKALPPEQRDRFEKAREIAKQAPAVQSARAKMQTAQTPEARMEAGKEFREAMRAAMLTADPSLVDVIDKLPLKKPDAESNSKPDQP
jgi:Spy/CpxP family protein refolding chaperone